MTRELNSLPDEKLREAILAFLTSEDRVVFAALRVGVLNGIAHLAGSTPTLEYREMAEALAASVPGVRGVVNRIEAPGAPSPARTVHLDLSPTEEEGQ